MARVNVGIPPKYLSDRHLLSESTEITMITGSLRVNDFKIKGKILDKFCLGQGHINFFKNKLCYLARRLHIVNVECFNRGINTSTNINLLDYPKDLWGYLHDWQPTIIDSNIVRERVISRLLNPLKAKPDSHKYYGKPIKDLEAFIIQLKYSELCTE